MTKANTLIAYNNYLRGDSLVSRIGATVRSTPYNYVWCTHIIVSHCIHRVGLCLIVGLERGAVFLGGLLRRGSNFEIRMGLWSRQLDLVPVEFN